MTSDHSNRNALLVAAVTAAFSTAALAQVHPEKPTYPYEKCYGVAKAGLNDCFTPMNSCAATTTKDGEPQAWIYVPKGTCSRIVGGSNTPSK